MNIPGETPPPNPDQQPTPFAEGFHPHTSEATTPIDDSETPEPQTQILPPVTPEALSPNLDPAEAARARVEQAFRPGDTIDPTTLLRPLGPRESDVERHEERSPSQKVTARLVEYAAWAARNNSGHIRTNTLQNPRVAGLAFGERKVAPEFLKIKYSKAAYEQYLQDALRDPDDELAMKRLYMMSLHPSNPNSPLVSTMLVGELMKHNIFTAESIEAYNRAPSQEVRQTIDLKLPSNPYTGITNSIEHVRSSLNRLSQVTPSDDLVSLVTNEAPDATKAEKDRPSCGDVLQWAANTYAAKHVRIYDRPDANYLRTDPVKSFRSRHAKNRWNPQDSNPDPKTRHTEVPEIASYSDEELKQTLIGLLPVDYIKMRAGQVEEHLNPWERMDSAVMANATREEMLWHEGLENMTLEELVDYLQEQPVEKVRGFRVMPMKRWAKYSQNHQAAVKQNGLMRIADTLASRTPHEVTGDGHTPIRVETAKNVYEGLQRELVRRRKENEQNT